MKRDTVMAKPLKSSFLSCEKDAETIIKKLFVTSKPYSDELKRLLVINTKDCLDNSNENYRKIVENTSVKELIEGNYINLVPRIELKEHEEMKNYLLISFDDFTPTTNPEYRDCLVYIGILCHYKTWMLENYQLRPFKILGLIDGILDECKLSGIGTLQFSGCGELNLHEDYGGYVLIYKATHGNDDMVPEGE